MRYGFNEPVDVDGECNAHLYVADNFGDNHATMRCGKPTGHQGDHTETFLRGESKVTVTWIIDERRRSKTSHEDFIVLWQSSPDLATLNEKYDLGSKSATARAGQLRKRGIEMKKFLTGRRLVLDVEALNKLAKKSLPKAKPEA